MGILQGLKRLVCRHGTWGVDIFCEKIRAASRSFPALERLESNCHPIMDEVCFLFLCIC